MRCGRVRSRGTRRARYGAYAVDYDEAATAHQRKGSAKIVMTKAIPQIKKYMSTDIQTIGDEQTMLMAHNMMREGHFRHLPVLHQGKLVGIVSDRDLNLVESLSSIDPKLVPVSEAMTGEPYVVAPDTPLDEVVSTMAEKKYGSAVVCDNHKVVGIFTTVDACAALATLLSTRLTS